jgi:hypothetical protein
LFVEDSDDELAIVNVPSGVVDRLEGDGLVGERFSNEDSAVAPLDIACSIDCERLEVWVVFECGLDRGKDDRRGVVAVLRPIEVDPFVMGEWGRVFDSRSAEVRFLK